MNTLPRPAWDLLDLLGVMADNIRLLVFLPLLAGLLGYSFTSLSPRQYESVAVLSVAHYVEPTVLPALVGSADMLRIVIDKTGMPADLDPDEALLRWREMAKVTVSKQDKLVTFKVQGLSAERAQQLNQALIQEVFRLTRPRGEQKLALLAQLESEKSSMTSAQLLEAALVRQFSRGGAVSDDKGRTFSDVLQSKSRLAASIASLQLKLAGLGNDDVVQAPSLPGRPLGERKTVSAATAAMATAAVLLLIVLLREALFSARATADKAQKLARIRRGVRALWSRSGPG